MGIAPLDRLNDVPLLAGRAVVANCGAWDQGLAGHGRGDSEAGLGRAHKLRSFLTLLAVILAVTTLISVMRVIAGLNTYVADRVANLGANVFIADRFGIITSIKAFLKAQKRPLITFEEYGRTMQRFAA